MLKSTKVQTLGKSATDTTVSKVHSSPVRDNTKMKTENKGRLNVIIYYYDMHTFTLSQILQGASSLLMRSERIFNER